MNLLELNNKIHEKYFNDINDTYARNTLERLYFFHSLIMNSDLPDTVKEKVCKVIRKEQIKLQNYKVERDLK